jgi:hypothetical protein
MATGPWTRYFPAIDEAMSRAMLGFFGAGVVLLAAYVLGVGICRLLAWRPDQWREALLYHTTIGLGAVSYLSLGLALLGLYRPEMIKISVAGVILCGGLGLFWKFIFQKRATGGRIKSPAFSKVDRPWNWVWKAVVVMSILAACIGALAPEVEFDSLLYHLTLPKVWLEQGGPVDIIGEYVSLYPMTWELIFGVGMVFGGPIAAKLLHFACLTLAALLVYQFTRHFMPRGSPWLAVAFFVTIPIVLWEATTAYIDLALALHIGLVIYALMRYVEGRQWQWLGLATLNLGLSLATKHLAWFALILTGSGLTLWLWVKSHDLREALLPGMVLMLFSLLLPLPWYIRSYQASGNPVFPEFFNIFGAWPPERWDAITQEGLNHFLVSFGRPRNVMNLVTLPWDMTVHAARYGGTLGPMFLLLLPILVLLRRSSKVTLPLMSFVVLYLILWASPVSSLQMRFLLPITPILAVLAAEASNRLVLIFRTTMISWGRLAFYGGLAIIFLLNLPPFIPFHEVDREGWNGWLTHVIYRLPMGVVTGREYQENYLTRSVPSYAAWRYINTYTPESARILTFSDGDHFYSERERIWSDSTMARPAAWGAPAGQERQAIQTLSKLGISHVLFDKRQLNVLESRALAIAQPSIIDRWFEEKYQDRRFVLYRVRWEAINNR